MSQPSVGAVLRYFLKHKRPEVEEALRQFTGALYIPQKSKLPDEQSQSFFSSWFLFDHRLPASGDAPLAEYLKEKQHQISDQKAMYFRCLLETNVFDIFEVLRVDVGQGLRLRQLRTGTEFEISEHQGTYHITAGQAILGRIWFTGAVWQLAPDILVYPAEVLELFRAQADKMSDPLTPPDVWLAAARQEITTREAGMEALDSYLRDHEADPAFTPVQVLAWLREDKDLQRTLQRVVQHIKPKSQAAFVELLQILNAIWQTLSVREKGGADDKEEWQPGPVERALLEELHTAAMAAIDPDNYTSLVDVNEALAEYQSRWIDAPLPRQSGKTPRQLVAEERQASGHPNQDWTVQLQIKRLGDAEAERAIALLKAGNEAHRRGDLIDAEQYYRQLIAEYDKPYQAWGNLGLVLASQGKKQAAIKALQTALYIEPNYQLARLNLEFVANASAVELQHQRNVVRASVLRIGLYDKFIDQLTDKVASSEVKDVPALHDMIAILAYVRDRGPLKLTPARQEFSLADTRSINQQLRQPVPVQETFTGPRGATTWQRRSQAEFETINLLYCLLLAMQLARSRSGRYHLTRRGRRYLSLSPFEQYCQLMWGYFAELNWASLSNHIHSVAAHFVGMARQTVQERAPERLGLLLRYGRDGAWVPLTQLYPITDKVDDKALLSTALLKFPEEDMLWHRLAWFGLTESQHAEANSELPLRASLEKIRLTPLGLKVVAELATEVAEAPIPKVGRNEPCPCGAAKPDGHPVKYKHCHGR